MNCGAARAIVCLARSRLLGPLRVKAGGHLAEQPLRFLRARSHCPRRAMLADGHPAHSATDPLLQEVKRPPRLPAYTEPLDLGSRTTCPGSSLSTDRLRDAGFDDGSAYACPLTLGLAGYR